MPYLNQEQSDHPQTFAVIFSFNDGEVQLIFVIDAETTTINNSDSLPYHDHNNNDTLFVENLPECLIPQQKLTSKDKISCFLCGEEMKCGIMWEVILHALHNTEDPKTCCLRSVGENPCGFCGQDGCFTQLKLKKPAGFSIASNVKIWCVSANTSNIRSGYLIW